MTNRITLKELLNLVSVEQNSYGDWRILDVHGTVYGNVDGNVNGIVGGDVLDNIDGKVYGRINGKEWQFIETPKDKLKRLIEEKGDEELIEAFNQLENN